MPDVYYPWCAVLCCAVQYDMWEHTDKPPKGNEYGLLTRKLHAAPRSQEELRLLLGDRNAWVGIPVSVLAREETRREPPAR